MNTNIFVNWVNYNNLVAHVVKEIDKEKNEVLRKKKEGIERKNGN